MGTYFLDLVFRKKSAGTLVVFLLFFRKDREGGKQDILSYSYSRGRWINTQRESK